MFTPTRPQRQVLATLAVLTLAMAPTVGVALWVWKLNRPGHVRDVEMELSRQLGLSVSLESVRHPRPDLDVLCGLVVRLEESESGPSRLEEVARAEEVRLSRDGSRLALEVEGLTLSAEGPEQAIEQVETLLRQADSRVERLDLVALEGQLELGRGPKRTLLPFRNLAAILKFQRGRASLSASGRLAVPGSPNRCELHLTRESGSAGPGLAVRCQVVEGLLPARLLNPLFNADEWLGRSAMLRGSLAFQRLGRDGWEVDFRGLLDDVDLASLVDEHFPPHRLTGLARLEVEEARWGDLPGGQGRGWTSVKGRLSCGQGTVGADLLRGMASEMHFHVAGIAAGDDGEVAYQRLGLAFRLQQDGEIHLGGALGSGFPPDAVLVNMIGTSPLARRRQGRRTSADSGRCSSPLRPTCSCRQPPRPRSSVTCRCRASTPARLPCFKPIKETVSRVPLNSPQRFPVTRRELSKNPTRRPDLCYN